MIKTPMDVLSTFPVRKSVKQKKAFRKEIEAYCGNLGYECTCEKTGLMGRNLIIGNPKTAKHLITAHYDTCAGMLLPNFITPCNFWIYLLYQIALTLVLMIPAAIVSAIIFGITKNMELFSAVFLAVLFIVMLLMMYGPANKSNANDNTSGVITVLKIASALPEAYRDDVCFVLFDLEEAGLIGSSAYRSAHKKETKHQIIWNFDCVGDGDEILFFPGRRAKRNPAVTCFLEKCNAQQGDKRVSVNQGFHFYPSDQANFPYGIGIAALKKGKVGLYMDKIHTRKDSVMEEENTDLLCRTMLSAITSQE